MKRQIGILPPAIFHRLRVLGEFPIEFVDEPCMQGEDVPVDNGNGEILFEHRQRITRTPRRSAIAGDARKVA